MKKASIIILTLILISMLTTSVFANSFEEILVYVDGKKVDFPDQKPYVNSDGRTLVPVRFPAEKFGAKVSWDGEERKVTITDEEKKKEVNLWINKSEYNVNNEVKEMDTKPIITNSRTVVPVRFVAEALGVRVKWKVVDNKGVVHNFTKGQSDEEVKRIMEEIAKEIKEDNKEADNATPKTEEEYINTTIEFAKENGYKLDGEINLNEDNSFGLEKDGDDTLIVDYVKGSKNFGITIMFEGFENTEDLETLEEFKENYKERTKKVVDLIMAHGLFEDRSEVEKVFDDFLNPVKPPTDYEVEDHLIQISVSPLYLDIFIRE